MRAGLIQNTAQKHVRLLDRRIDSDHLQKLGNSVIEAALAVAGNSQCQDELAFLGLSGDLCSRSPLRG